MKQNPATAGISPGRPRRCLGLAALFLALVLCGCAQEAPAPQPSSPEEAIETASSSPRETEQPSKSALRAYPLDLSRPQGMVRMGDGLLVFSGEDTTLTLLRGGDLTVSASVSLGFPLSFQDPSLQFHGNSLSYFDSSLRETVVLDSALAPVTHIPAPAGLSGTPVLSRDRNTLYYCTATALIAWDLESGIHRMVKEMSYPNQSVTGLPTEGSLVQCAAEKTLFLDAATGRLVKEWDNGLHLYTQDGRFYAAFPMGFETALVFGSPEQARILLPANAGDPFFLPDSQALVIGYQSAERELRLDHYDLVSGKRTSQLILDSGAFPLAMAGMGQDVYLLMCDENGAAIYCWDPAALPIQDTADHTAAYLLDPQPEDLAQCRAYAQEIAVKYGIEILIGKEAVKRQPWDYDLEAESQSAIARLELARLDSLLSRFPAGMLAQTAGDFASLELCLVRSVTGSAESGSRAPSTGVSFLDGSDACIAIAPGRFAEEALYHELFHILETHIFTYSIAFDQWDALNPAGFRYDYSYSANAQRDSGVYLDAESRAFIDTFSMSFPKEDRARIFTCAMLPGNASLFRTEAMQRKLQCICDGLREAYGLEDSPETFPWEQYLDR